MAGKAIIDKLRPGETFFGGGAGVLIPFRFSQMNSSSKPSPEEPYSDTAEGVDEEHPWVGAKRLARMQHQNEQFRKMAQQRKADESKDD
jgi:hypothetical protein